MRVKFTDAYAGLVMSTDMTSFTTTECFDWLKNTHEKHCTWVDKEVADEWDDFEEGSGYDEHRGECVLMSTNEVENENVIFINYMIFCVDKGWIYKSCSFNRED